MFDIGFIELLVIGIAALVLIGPERLPEVMREIGRVLGQLRRSTRELQQNLERELNTDEFVRPLQEDFTAGQNELRAAEQELRETGRIILPPGSTDSEPDSDGTADSQSR